VVTPEALAPRVLELIADYEPPSFEHVPSAEFALFMCAIDHKAGYEREHPVGDRGPFRGSELMWEVAVAAEQREPGRVSAPKLVSVTGPDVSALLAVDGDTVTGLEERARLWRDLATKLVTGYEPRACAEGDEPVSHAQALLDSANGSLAGDGGLLSRLAAFEAYADPLRKKSFLFAKICERRGWIAFGDPESWQVCADSVLMRVALRCGLVEPTGDLEALRAAARDAWRSVAQAADAPVPLLDDLLWERGRDDPDLLGSAGADRHGPGLTEPPRPLGEIRY
jgi:hypothetical protein